MARRQFPHTTPGGEGRCILNRAESDALAPGHAHRLRNLRGVLVTRAGELAALDRRATIFRERLPDAQRKLDALESAVNPDASRDELLDFAVETIRLQLLKGFLANYSDHRRAAENAIGATLTDLSRLFGEIQPRRQTSELPFMAGHTLESRVAIALAEITSLLP